MAPTALLFDLDGTVWDSFPWYAGLLARASGGKSAALHSELCRGASIVTLARQRGISNGRFVAECEASLRTLRLYPGTLATLEALASRGTPTAAVTSLPGWIAQPLLCGLQLGPLFRWVVDASNCASRKPRPGPVLAALQRLRIAPDHNVFYVGDRNDDAAAAKAAGVRFAWASYGYGDGCPTPSAVRLSSIDEVLGL